MKRIMYVHYYESPADQPSLSARFLAANAHSSIIIVQWIAQIIAILDLMLVIYLWLKSVETRITEYPLDERPIRSIMTIEVGIA
jgi:hypothetical protein